ncbi:MAG: SPASM domain-containing protein [Defluviitaleaceae bacterium]|nr:SPASM domain-containing protein [Defluviitaleaceae bacterium]
MKIFDARELSDVHYDVLYDLIKNRIDAGIKNLCISWFGGEPLLKHKELLKFSSKVMDLVDLKNINFVGGMTTNGVVLDTEIFNKLVSAGIRNYQITLDGFSHDKQRIFKGGRGSFDIIHKNIINILKTDIDFELVLRVNISKKEFDFRFYDLFKEFVDDKRLIFLIKAIERWSDKEIEIPIFKSANEATKEIKKHHAYIKEMGLKLYAAEKEGFLCFSCHAASPSYYVIRGDGTICKCTVVLGDDINSIGRINLNNKNLEIDEHKMRRWTDMPINQECRTCSLLYKCFNRACPLARIKYGNDSCTVFNSLRDRNEV